MQAAEQHDLAGQVVDLGAAGLAGDALPRGATGRGGARPPLQDVAPSLLVLRGRDQRDAGGADDLLALGLSPSGELVGGLALDASRVDAVADVHQQLAVLPGHDVRPRRTTRTRRRGDRRRPTRSGGRCPRAPGRGRGCPGRDGTWRRPPRARDGSRAASRTPRRHGRTAAAPRARSRPRWSRRRSAVPAGAWAARSSRAAAAWWDFTASRQTVSLPQSTSAAVSVAGASITCMPRARVQPQSVLPDPLQVLAAGDQGGRVTGQGEMPPDHATDGAGAVDDVPHRRAAPGGGRSGECAARGLTLSALRPWAKVRARCRRGCPGSRTRSG